MSGGNGPFVSRDAAVNHGSRVKHDVTRARRT